MRRFDESGRSVTACARLAGIVGLWVAVACVPASAAVTARSWKISTTETFANGTLTGTQVDEEGRLCIAPRFRTLWGPAEGIVWAVATAPEGAAFVALSGPGRLLHVDPRGQVTLWYEDPADGLVTALASDGSGGAYFAVSGTEGRVLQASGPDRVTLVVETGSKFVWSLLLDGTGKLWAGTGEPGKIMSRSPGERWNTVLETGGDPVRSLAAFADNRVVAGTGLEGRVIRIDAEGRPFVVLDADQDEIVSLATDPSGRLFALAAGAAAKTVPQRGAAPTSNGPGPSATVHVTASPDGASSPPSDRPAGEASRPPARPPRAGGALYRIDPDGGIWKIWDTTTEIPFAVALDALGFPIVATGAHGRIIRMNPDGQTTRILRFPSDSASGLVAGSDGRILVGGTTDARLSEIGPDLADEAVYRTATLDAGALADWGRIRWDADLPGGSRLRIRVRSGNTDEPDETWSEWTLVDSARTEQHGPVGAPPARRIQVELDLVASKAGSSPRVRSLEIHYRTRNRPPRIERLSVGPPGEAWARVPQQSSTGKGPLVTDDPVARETSGSLQPGERGATPIRRAYESGARTFSWSAQDPDGDKLVYMLEVRREGEESWAPLVHSIEDEFYSWDARTLPDGDYRVRLSVNDGPDNPLGKSHSDLRVSSPFAVDNTPPGIEDLDVEPDDAGFAVRFEATDPGGQVVAAEFALDDGPWTFVDPVDGVADSASESYRFGIPHVEDPAEQAHLKLRVTDESGNVAGALQPLAR